MHEVADARAVGRRIIGAEQGEGRAEAERGIGGQRQQMGLRIVRLADRPAGVRAGGVEVAQGRRAQAATRGLGERLLDPGLRLGIGADRGDRDGSRPAGPSAAGRTRAQELEKTKASMPCRSAASISAYDLVTLLWR